jgi:deoxyribonuclease-4
VASFLDIIRENAFAPILAHAPYTLNPCGSDARVRAFAHEVMADDMRRMEYTPGNYYNFHPGSHVGQGIDRGIELIVDLLDVILRPEQTTLVLLETMSGKGSEVGSRFEELRAIIDRVALPEKLGVCFDTCHTNDAGYDVVHDLDGVLSEFDRVIGLDRLRAVHLNDSKNPYASHKDRHEKIGQGTLGLATVTNVITHPALRDLPFYLETPNEVEGYAEEIRLLRGIRPD